MSPIRPPCSSTNFSLCTNIPPEPQQGSKTRPNICDENLNRCGKLPAIRRIITWWKTAGRIATVSNSSNPSISLPKFTKVNVMFVVTYFQKMSCCKVTQIA